MEYRARILCAALLAGCGGSGRTHDLPGDGGTPHDFAGGGCIGLQCQQVPCDNGGDTVITGRLFAPNGLDPVPGAFVYVPNLGLPEFPVGVACDLCGDIEGAAASTKTAYDGTFTLSRVPAGADIPLVYQLGRFRRVTHLTVNACETQEAPRDVSVEGARLPKRDGEQDANDSVPKIALATGDWDQIECVLKRMGLEQFDLYDDRDGQPPATVGTLAQLLNNPQKLEGYNILVVNCTNNQFESVIAQAGARKNLFNFVAKGGRLYATDWAYDVIEQVPEFTSYLCFQPEGGFAPMCSMTPQSPAVADSVENYDNQATILDPELAEWLTLFPNVIDNQKQVPVLFSFVVVSGVANDMTSFPTKVWAEGPAKGYGTKPMTITFDYNQCGRVHYSTYNTEPNGIVPDNVRFPNCTLTPSPQERILEYLVFEIASCIPNPG